MLEKHRKWVTREKAKVDRIGCPWLIKTFVDSEPEFLFVPVEKVLDTAKEQNAIPFDIPNVELGHQDGKCSFDAIIEKYNLEGRALQELAKIVRGADTDQPDPPPESIGLEAIAEVFDRLPKMILTISTSSSTYMTLCLLQLKIGFTCHGSIKVSNK
jgi:hypothetical protein